MENQLLPISPCETQERSASADALIRQWLFRFSVNFEKDIAPVLPLWLETFGGINTETLEPLFRRAFRTCKFFPKVADILEPLNAVEEINLEDEWQTLLDYCRRWVSPDIPNPRGKPELPPEIDHAARAAGGLLWIESCPTEELQWAKKRFIEDLQRSRKTGDLAVLLTGGELRKFLRNATQPVARPPDVIPCTPAIAAARSSLESAGDTFARMAGPICVKRVVDIEGRRAELERQKQLILQKYSPIAKEPIPPPVEGNRCD